MDANTAISLMWSIADKPERLRCFDKIVSEIGITDAEVFWKEFWSIWTTSENLHEEEDFIHPLIDYGRELGSPLLGLSEKEVAALDAMDAMVTIYRGGGHWNLLGWSWTTDYAKAKWFAERAHGDKERIVAKAVVAKTDILAYLLGRGESEVVINPLDVDVDVGTIEEFEVEPDPKGALFYAIHAGKYEIGGGGSRMDKVRAEMMANTIPHVAIENNIAEMQQMLDFARWADLRSKRGFFEEMIKALRFKLENPGEEPATFSI